MTLFYHKYKDTHRSVRGKKQKYCIKCNQWKVQSEFGTDRHKRDGLKINCRECSRLYNAALRKKYRKGKKFRIYLRFEQRHRTVEGIREKLCSKCGKWKKESEYCKDKSCKDGLTPLCRKCLQKDKERHYLNFEMRHRTVDGVREKLCSKCGKWKKESEYCKDNSSKDGLSRRCRKCSQKPGKDKERHYLNFEMRHRTVDGVREKLCSKCGSWKRESEFYKSVSKRDVLSDWCRKCSYTPISRKKKTPFVFRGEK